ncbi:MAG: hypothetical protein NVS4B3_16550 [Gemmatimonadaceae bacterium]
MRSTEAERASADPAAHPRSPRFVTRPSARIERKLGAIPCGSERGVAPDVIIARHLTNGVEDRSRPVYPYPLLTRYTGTGDPTKASSFVPLKPQDR